MSDASSAGDPRPGGGDQPPDVFEARILVTRESLPRLLATFELDIGCRHAHVDPNPDGSGVLLAYATDEQIRRIEAAGWTVSRGENVSAQGRERQAEVGRGDRFEDGRVAPRGFGLKGQGPRPETGR